jgi:hypothetical protein
VVVVSWYDETAEQRERGLLPRYIARPSAPNHPGEDPSPEDMRAYSDAMYRWRHSWELHYEIPRGGWGKLVRDGWEVRHISPGRRMDFLLAHEPPRRDEINAWADGFINGTGVQDLIWPEDREAVLIEVARRLREATADGFLLRALEAVS